VTAARCFVAIFNLNRIFFYISSLVIGLRRSSNFVTTVSCLSANLCDVTRHDGTAPTLLNDLKGLSIVRL